MRFRTFPFLTLAIILLSLTTICCSLPDKDYEVIITLEKNFPDNNPMIELVESIELTFEFDTLYVTHCPITKPTLELRFDTFRVAMYGIDLERINLQIDTCESLHCIEMIPVKIDENTTIRLADIASIQSKLDYFRPELFHPITNTSYLSDPEICEIYLIMKKSELEKLEQYMRTNAPEFFPTPPAFGYELKVNRLFRRE